MSASASKLPQTQRNPGIGQIRDTIDPDIVSGFIFNHKQTAGPQSLVAEPPGFTAISAGLENYSHATIN
ncbi:hypothetical protein [Gemmobacter caeruleus]|uniref:hypothetical protein n=1 Tax=Gemmobacter caeruleus TaxID=2595004 RepID=UPI00193A777D|nr:hypothetical protein [Gemmobacter caeruleus]